MLQFSVCPPGVAFSQLVSSIWLSPPITLCTKLPNIQFKLRANLHPNSHSDFKRFEQGLYQHGIWPYIYKQTTNFRAIMRQINFTTACLLGVFFNFRKNDLPKQSHQTTFNEFILLLWIYYWFFIIKSNTVVAFLTIYLILF